MRTIERPVEDQPGQATRPPLPHHVSPRTARPWRLPRPWRGALTLLALVALSNLLLDTLGANLAVVSDDWGAIRQIRACVAQGTQPDVVILGSSRAQAGIAPPILSAELAARLGRAIVVCDVAVTTSVPLQDELILRDLYAAGVRPRLILYATADYAFNSAVVDHNVPVQDNVEYLARLSDLPMLAGSAVPGGGPWRGSSWYVDFLATRLVRLYADRRGIEAALCQAAPDFGPCPGIVPPPDPPVFSPATPLRQYPIDAAQGWFPLPEMTARSLANSQTQYTAWLAHYQVAPEALHALGDLVALARSHGAQVVLINTPILPVHLSYFPQVADYATYLDALYTFAAAQRVPFFDAGLGFDDDWADFADSNHLNYWGALRFTGWLAIAVVLPVWEQLRAQEAARH